MDLNKKGFVPIGIVALLVVVGGILGISFLVSEGIRFTLIGIGIIAATFVYVIPSAVSGELDRQKVALIGILIALGLFVIFLPSLGLVSQTILGVSDVTFLSSNPEDKIIITMTPDSENAIVDLSKASLNGKLNVDGYEVTRGVRIETSLVSFKERFTLRKVQNDVFYKLNDNTDLGNANIFTQGFKTYPEACQDEVGNLDYVGYYLHEEGGFSIKNLICVSRQAVGTRAQIDGSGFDEFDVEVKADGETAHITRDNQIASLKSGAIKVSFEGQLSAPQSIKEIPFDILFADSQYKHLIERSASGMAGESALTSRYAQCTTGTDPDHDEATIRNCLEDWNDDLDSKLQNKNSAFAPSLVDSLNFETDSGSTQNGELIATLNPGTSTKLPVLRMEVDGTFLGVEKLSGDPEITECALDIDTISGREEDLVQDVKIKNIGNEKGTFLLSGSCNNDKIDLLLPNQVVVNSGQTNSIQATVTGVADEVGVTETAVCTLTVKDKNTPSNSDSCSFDVNIEFEDTICEPNQTYCSTDNKQILKCNEFGDEKDVLVEECGSGMCVDGGGEITCDGSDTQTDDDDLDCKFYESKVIENTEDCGFGGYKKVFGTCEPVSTSKCQTSSLVTLGAIGFFALAAIGIMFAVSKSSKSSKKKGKARKVN